jgi:hypothetical protein
MLLPNCLKLPKRKMTSAMVAMCPQVWETTMRTEVHNTLARFRVNDALLASATERARREGMTLSELIRAALRRELAS